MSKYDYPDPNSAPPPSGAPRLELWDMLSILVVLITVCIGAYFLLIFLNPLSDLNPLKNVDPKALPTFTITPIQLAATWTASPTIEPTITETPRPTFTPLASPTFFSLIPPTSTSTVTATPKAPFSANVSAISSTIFHPDAACNWLGVGGTVVDAKNTDMRLISVRLVGTLNGKRVDMLTASATALAYGKSGFEFYLGNVPISSKDALYIQLLDQAGLPLSDNIYIATFNDCNKNLILVRFKMNR
jgi:hypothetical protein